MKKFLYLLLVMPFLCALSACDDDDNIPQVNLSIDYKGATLQDGVLYVVQGEPLEITALRAIPDEGTKAATISSATYYWDGIPAERIFASPFPVTVNTTDMEVGRHTLGVYANVLQVDKSIGFAAADFPVVIVASSDELPGDAGGGTINPDTRMTRTEE